MTEQVPNRADSAISFQKKVWIVCSTTALFVALIWFFKVTFNVLLLILTGALVALFFHGYARLIQRKLRVPAKLSLLISIISTFVIISLLLWFMGARIQEQVTELAKTLPSTISNAQLQLSKTSIGQKILEKTSSEQISDAVYSYSSSFFNSTFGVFTNIYIIVFLGIFFTISPGVYINGFLILIPAKGRQQAKGILDKIGFTLTQWLKGQIFSMIIIALLKWVALIILDIPMAIALALIAGILNFIPNFGPLISMFPAILIALTISVDKAIVVTIVYLLLQIFEGNVITPSIQQRLINMPAALIIIAQLFMGIVSGGWGLVLATPLVAILIVVVQETYLKKNNNGITRIRH
jgi:predicted PurR-regulated permease PerM